jgi:hypothetical protein
MILVAVCVAPAVLRYLRVSVGVPAPTFDDTSTPAYTWSPVVKPLASLAGIVAGESTAGVFYMLAALQAASIVATVTSLKKGE